MKKIAFISTALIVCTSTFNPQSALAEADRPQHFAGLKIDSWQQAQATLNSANSELRVLLNKGDLTMADSVKIHELSYSMENALQFMREQISATETALEELHLSSESAAFKQTQQLAMDYLKQVETLK